MKTLQKEGWGSKKLGEVCSFKNGFNFNKGYLETGFKVINVFDFQDYFSPDYDTLQPLVADKIPSEEYLLKKNDVVFVRSNGNKELIGRTLLVDEEPFRMTFSAFCIRARLNDENLLPKYFAYFTKSDVFKSKLRSLVRGTYIGNISQGLLTNVSIPLPPLDEQNRIVEFFQSVEQSMVRAQAQEGNLLKLKKHLLRELFGEKKRFGNYLTAKDFEKAQFEKVALNISERVEPKETPLNIYVGLEHIDSDDLVIRRKGKPEDVIGTKLKIYKGDIIFGKRRAYLRKVAVSDFDGIVSAHSMVLRANEENIEKEFLPYFMQSDAFMNRAMQISEGSLSPTIKWKTLAQQEFSLPRKEKQTRLIEIFKQLDATREHLRAQTHTLKTLKQKLLGEILGE